MSVLAQPLLQRLGHFNAAAHHHYVNVVGGPFQENIAYIAAHDIAFYAFLVGHFAYLVEYLLV